MCPFEMEIQTDDTILLSPMDIIPIADAWICRP